MADIVGNYSTSKWGINTKMEEGQIAQSDMEVRSIDGESSPLSLGRHEDRHKEQHGGKQYNGGT